MPNSLNKTPPVRPGVFTTGVNTVGAVAKGTGHAAYSVAAFGGRVVKNITLLTINAASTSFAKNALSTTYFFCAVTTVVTATSGFIALDKGLKPENIVIPALCGLATGVVMLTADSAFRVSRWSANKLNNKPYQPLKPVL